LREEKKPQNAFSFLNNFLAPRGSEKRSGLGFILGEETTRSPESSTPLASKDSTTPTPVPSLSGGGSFVTPTPTPSPSPSTPTSSTATPTPAALSLQQTAVKTVAGAAIDLLTSRDFRKLYDLMSAEFKEVFGSDDFVSSFASAADVVSGQLVGSPTVYGGNQEWADQSVSLVLNGGSQKNYLLIFHLENGSWKLSGTEDK